MSKMYALLSDYKIRRWNSKTFQELNDLDCTFTLNKCQDFIPFEDESYVCTLKSLLNACNIPLINQIPSFTSPCYKCISSIISLNNEHYALGDYFGHVYVYDSKRTLYKTLSSHSKEILSLEFFGESFLLSGSGDNTIKLWNYITGELKQTFNGHTRGVNCLKTIEILKGLAILNIII